MSERMTEEVARRLLKEADERDPFTMPCEWACNFAVAYYGLRPDDELDGPIDKLTSMAEGYLLRVEQENADLTRFREAHKEATERNLDLHFQLRAEREKSGKLVEAIKQFKAHSYNCASCNDPAEADTPCDCGLNMAHAAAAAYDSENPTGGNQG